MMNGRKALRRMRYSIECGFVMVELEVLSRTAIDTATAVAPPTSDPTRPAMADRSCRPFAIAGGRSTTRGRPPNSSSRCLSSMAYASFTSSTITARLTSIARLKLAWASF